MCTNCRRHLFRIGLTPNSNVWVGAWWIGFLAAAVICFVIAIPILAFPAALPGMSTSIWKRRRKDFSFIPSGTSNLKYTCVRNRFVTFDVIDVSFVITYYLSEINFILPSYSFYTTLIILKTKIIPVVLFI